MAPTYTVNSRDVIVMPMRNSAITFLPCSMVQSQIIMAPTNTVHQRDIIVMSMRFSAITFHAWSVGQLENTAKLQGKGHMEKCPKLQFYKHQGKLRTHTELVLPPL